MSKEYFLAVKKAIKSKVVDPEARMLQKAPLPLWASSLRSTLRLVRIGLLVTGDGGKETRWFLVMWSGEFQLCHSRLSLFRVKECGLCRLCRPREFLGNAQSAPAQVLSVKVTREPKTWTGWLTLDLLPMQQLLLSGDTGPRISGQMQESGLAPKVVGDCERPTVAKQYEHARQFALVGTVCPLPGLVNIAEERCLEAVFDKLVGRCTGVCFTFCMPKASDESSGSGTNRRRPNMH